MTLPVFPLSPQTHPTFSVHRKPTYNSILLSDKANNRETTTFQETVPFWEFELKYDVLRDKTRNVIPDSTHVGDFLEFQTLAGFYWFVGGQYAEFYFDDWTDNSREKQLIGIGDGATKEFRLLRTIVGADGLEFTEAVGGANLGHSVVVYIDNVAQDPLTWTISDDLTTLVFTTAPGLNLDVNITYYYYYKCKFTSNRYEFEQFVTNRWSLNSLKFQSIITELGINPLNPTDSSSSPICLNDFVWYQATENADAGVDDNPPCRLDVHGNYYWRDVLASPKELVITNGSTGTVLNTYVAQDIGTLIDTWYGGSIVDNTGGSWNDVYFNAAPVYYGQYILVHIRAIPGGGSFDYWWALCQPSSGGTLTVVGAIYYNTGVDVTAPPYVNGVRIYDAFSASNPLYIGCYAFVGGFEFVVLAVPSIGEFVSNTWAAGWGGASPLKVRCAAFDPIGNSADLSDKFMQSTFTDYTQPRGMGFLLPDRNGGVSLYQYLNRNFMDGIVGAGTACPEIQDVIQPAYPLGCILKMPLGNLSYTDLASSATVTAFVYLTSTGDYSIDNANWRDSSGAAVIPFSDEYTYISTDAPGGVDGYSMQIGGVQIKNNGKFWVTFYMEGHDDYNHYATGNTYNRVRIFEFDPTTQVGTQQTIGTCILHTDVEIPHTPITPTADIFQATILEIDAGTATVVIYPLIYKTNLLTFSVT